MENVFIGNVFFHLDDQISSRLLDKKKRSVISNLDMCESEWATDVF